MVPVAAGGIHSKEDQQEKDYDYADNAPFGHAAAHFDERGVETTVIMKANMWAVTSDTAWLKE